MVGSKKPTWWNRVIENLGEKTNRIAEEEKPINRRRLQIYKSLCLQSRWRRYVEVYSTFT
jgi:hypothetical protein